MTSPPAAPAASWPDRQPSGTESTLSQVDTALATWWPEPAAAGCWILTTAGAIGLLAALLLPDAPRLGINLPICAVAAAIPVAVLVHRRGRQAGRRWPIGRIPVALGAVAIGLATVSAVRASEWLVWGCAAAAGCLGAAVVLDGRRAFDVLATIPLFGVAVLRALPWAARAGQSKRVRLSRPWVIGTAIGTLSTVAVAGLLASADAAFADVIASLWPAVDLTLLPARGLLFIGAAGATLGALFAASTTLTLPPEPGRDKPVTRHPAEWLLPLVLVTVTIAAFLAVEATQAGAASHADRARQGFGQLTAVTLIVLVLLAWSGRAAAPGPRRHRRQLGGVGGVLLLLALLLAGSALRRLWLYQDAYGWTVTRLNAGAFELWVAVVLLGVGVGWLLRRTDLVPRFLAGSAGLGLLVLSLLGPDALVASADVDRYQVSGQIDADYLSLLSADAVPALDRLPEPLRSCVLADQRPADDPWAGWNLSRSRADAVLRSHPPAPCFDR
jgi:hypothetical protein